MGLSGARNSAVTGLQAQSTNISISADNIANAATPGYKAVTGQFSTLVTTSGTSTGYSSGGVSVKAQSIIDKQGLINSTGRVTDLAISGTGFFAVQDNGGNLLLTRAGSFDINNKGELVNAAGYKLLGWPLDNDGRKPGSIGNLNTTAAESTSSLVVIDTNSASGTASATTTIKAGLNLDAGEATYQGATVTVTPQSTSNATNSQYDIIAPGTGMSQGNSVTFTSDGLSSSFVYGGYAQSADLTNGAIFGASLTKTAFTPSSTLVDGDQFKISTTSSGEVTFTYRSSAPDTDNGEFNSFDTLATAINSVSGLTARTVDTVLYVSSDNATEAVTFTSLAGSDLVNELGLSDVAAAAAGVNRYNTIYGLSTLVKSTSQLNAIVNDPASGASLDIFSIDPTLTLTIDKNYSAGTIDLQSHNNGGNTESQLIVPTEGSDMTIGTSSVSFSDGTNTGTFVYGGITRSADITAGAGLFGVTSTSAAWVAGIADGDSLQFTDGVNTSLFTFDSTSPDTTAGAFNSLDTLAETINNDGDFIAKVEGGRLYVASAEDSSRILTITDPTGTANVTLAMADQAAVADRFASLAQLDALVEGITNFDTTLTTGANANIAFSTTNGDQITIGGVTNTDLLRELGLATGAAGDGLFEEFGIDGIVDAGDQTAEIGITYDPEDSTINMAGGNIIPDFPRNIEIFDALGTGHSFRLSFLKIGANQWSVEFYALDPSQIVGRADGQIANGIVEFNGDGTLKSVSSTLEGDIIIPWTTGATSNTLNFNLGTAGEPAGTSGATVIGQTDGLRQFDSTYNVEFIEQNGVAAGQFKGITVSEDGTILANFSNGEIKPIYKLPIMTVANINGLAAKTGNVFAITQASGEVNLKDAGLGGAGVVVPGALEGSTADIAEELTNTIGIQSNYNANATLISTIKAMEEELNRRL
ncbi:MAG: flgE [Rickettsiaceae bacterium]|jgi:flagellar hook-basal body protein|nr:flgE [Rickettsiaceae bacterium]